MRGLRRRRPERSESNECAESPHKRWKKMCRYKQTKKGFLVGLKGDTLPD
jgi:hypothetical protein